MLLALLGACAPDGGATAVDQRVGLKDFAITVGPASLRAGSVVFGLHNAGPTVHEMVVVRTDRAADDLPLGKDGLSVDEDDPSIQLMGEMEEVQLGAEHDLGLRLPAGHYVLFCNLAGHYLGGMHAAVEVAG